MTAWQQKAAEQTEGAVLVLAVPGSGQNHGFGNPFRVYDKMQGHKPGKYPNRYIYKGRHRGYGMKGSIHFSPAVFLCLFSEP